MFVLWIKENKVTFKIGNSLLTLKQDKNFKPYHIAINIPCNMDFDALKFQIPFC